MVLWLLHRREKKKESSVTAQGAAPGIVGGGGVVNLLCMDSPPVGKPFGNECVRGRGCDGKNRKRILPMEPVAGVAGVLVALWL